MDTRRLFESLVRDNAQGLMIFLGSAVRDPELRDQLFQDTLVRSWKVLDRYDETRPFGQWLRGIARNVIREHAKRARRDLLVTDAAVLDLVEEHCASVQRLRSDVLDERLEQLRACIDGLPQQYRHAISYRYRDEIRGPQLAERLGVSWENTKKRLQRGRRLLFDCMQSKWTQPERVLKSADVPKEA